MLAPTDLAAQVLSRLSERGLPATPENYAAAFKEISVITPAPVQNVRPAVPKQLMEVVRSIVEIVNRTTVALADDIGRHNVEFRQSLDELSEARAPEDIIGYLKGLIGSAESMHAAVEVSRLELLETRQRLEQVEQELRESRKLLQIDPLTGAHNRRGMEAVMRREVARSRRHGNPLAVSMLDVDFFKKINDTYGHAAGDRALARLAEIARSVMRETDVLVRYGGEEFLLVLPDTDIDGADFVVDRIKHLVSKTPVNHEGKRFYIDFSGGIAQLMPDEKGADLVARADRALYDAKRAGRNRVLIYRDQGCGPDQAS